MPEPVSAKGISSRAHCTRGFITRGQHTTQGPRQMRKPQPIESHVDGTAATVNIAARDCHGKACRRLTRGNVGNAGNNSLLVRFHRVIPWNEIRHMAQKAQ